MDNNQIADLLELQSKLMEIHGENSFRAKSYSIAAFQIDRHLTPLSTLNQLQIADIKGVGDRMAEKVLEILESGKLSSLDKLIQATPGGVLEMMQVKGIGPKKLHLIWKEMGIESAGELLYACNENRLVRYKGFGEKVQQQILENVSYFLSNRGWFLYAQMEAICLQLIEAIRNQFPNQLFEFTGEFGRHEIILNQITLITTTPTHQLPTFFNNEGWKIVDSTGEQISATNTLGHLLVVHSVDLDRFYLALFEHTTPADFLKTISLPNPNFPYRSEVEIFEELKIPYLPPFARSIENLNYLKTHQQSSYIQPQDIRGIIHSHSTWSDGNATIEQMINAAQERGLEYLVISDHSQSAAYANGLSLERILQQHAEIDALNAKHAPFKVFKSIECDILLNGNLDYPDEVLALFDLVIASIHQPLQMTVDKATERLLTAISNPYVTILGHCTGRLLLSRKGYQFNEETIWMACKNNQVIVELNANPRRLDVDWSKLHTICNQMDMMISINPDAHSIKGFDDTRWGVMAAQKALIPASKNLSSYTLADFEAYLATVKKIKFPK